MQLLVTYKTSLSWLICFAMAKMILPLISFLSFFPFSYPATDTLTASDTLSNSQTLVSAGGVFVLGLFNETSSGYNYLGIWLKADANKVVWVDRENPITDSSGKLQIRSGNLVLTDRRQVPLIVNSGSLATTTTNTSATLVDTGNLVLKETATGATIWQSFDIPTDTYLPGMKIGLFGLNNTQPSFHILVSWASPQNPTRGLFTLSLDANNHTRISVWRGDGANMNIGFWEGDGLRFIFQNSTENMYNFSFQSNESEAFYTFSTPKNYDLMWFVMASTGTLDQYFLLDGKISNASHDLCEDSNGGNTGRCLTSLPSMCDSDGNFSEMNGLLPSNTTVGSINVWTSDCETLCKNNCSCTAFTSLHNGQPGCQLYYGSKQNLLKIIEKGTGVIYIRSGASSDGKKWKLWLSITVPLASLLISISIASFWYIRRRRKHKEDLVTRRESDEARLFQMFSNNASPMQLDGLRSANNMELGRQKDQDLPFFSFSSIQTATDDFAESNKLGEGGYGPVYKGKLLHEGQEIAVKRLSKISRQGLEEFKNEVSLICKLQHRNLVRLLGCCIEAEESILIYEFMPNNSLDSFIFDASKQVLLDWEKRVSIIEGIAQGLLYLHKYSRLRIIHRDLKTSNILLDCDMNPKISDFGMARIVGDNDIRGQTKRVVGTICSIFTDHIANYISDKIGTLFISGSFHLLHSGYLSPEYAMDGLFSEKSDVFSFGVIILEIISGKKNIAFFDIDQSHNLLGRAWSLWKDGDGLGLIDPALQASCSSNEVLMRYIQIGLLCVQERAIDRPNMSDIIFMLSNESIPLPRPKEPAFLSQFSSDADSSSSRQRYYTRNDITMSDVDAR